MCVAVEEQSKKPRGRPRCVPQHVEELIVQLSDHGLGCRAIASTLNANQIATARGGSRWWPATIRAVLRSRGVRQ
jgi:hypothetical protein